MTRQSAASDKGKGKEAGGLSRGRAKEGEGLGIFLNDAVRVSSERVTR